MIKNSIVNGEGGSRISIVNGGGGIIVVFFLPNIMSTIVAHSNSTSLGYLDGGEALYLFATRAVIRVHVAKEMMT
jgi:hypothetical protein